uniref:Uncharacterized protein n=1 Tax=Takifugu rubripes TaxID=31033 RepID=A0A3B5KC06_TAKRU
GFTEHGQTLRATELFQQMGRPHRRRRCIEPPAPTAPAQKRTCRCAGRRRAGS